MDLALLLVAVEQAVVEGSLAGQLGHTGLRAISSLEDTVCRAENPVGRA